MSATNDRGPCACGCGLIPARPRAVYCVGHDRRHLEHLATLLAGSSDGTPQQTAERADRVNDLIRGLGGEPGPKAWRHHA